MQMSSNCLFGHHAPKKMLAVRRRKGSSASAPLLATDIPSKESRGFALSVFVPGLAAKNSTTAQTFLG
eukprot:1753608-Rhodomonas_salina.2